MKKYLLAFVLTLSSCSNSGSNSESEAVQKSDTSLNGTWVYLNPTSTSSFIKGLGVKIENDKNIAIIQMYIYPNSNGTAVSYFRKSVGAYKNVQNGIEVNYSYETCNPVGSEVILFKRQNAKRVIVSNPDSSLILTLDKYEENDPNNPFSFTMIEDKNCNILSKLQTKNRSIASEVKKSYFDIK